MPSKTPAAPTTADLAAIAGRIPSRWPAGGGPAGNANAALTAALTAGLTIPEPVADALLTYDRALTAAKPLISDTPVFGADELLGPDPERALSATIANMVGQLERRRLVQAAADQVVGRVAAAARQAVPAWLDELAEHWAAGDPRSLVAPAHTALLNAVGGPGSRADYPTKTWCAAWNWAPGQARQLREAAGLHWDRITPDQVEDVAARLGARRSLAHSWAEVERRATAWAAGEDTASGEPDSNLPPTRQEIRDQRLAKTSAEFFAQAAGRAEASTPA